MSLPSGFVLAADAADAIPLHCVQRTRFDAWRQAQLPDHGQWLDAQRFVADAGSLSLLPGTGGGIGAAVLGVDNPHDPFAYAHAPFALPPGQYRLAEALDAQAMAALQLGWGLGSYRFDRYKQPKRAAAHLRLEDDPGDAEWLAVLRACLRVRDLVNTPTEHMGPDQLEALARELATTHAAEIEVIQGDALREGFPAIHAVGRASHRAPRLIGLHWGDADAPRLSLVGKGVCFDTGGLNIKASAGMRNMKKDMGGAAHALALAELVMAQRLPVRLSLWLPAVENAIGPDALRPGEVIATRKGVSVEIDNTDAEGRLILGDALTRACEDTPALLLDFATLTGAARVALGPDLPALYANHDALADAWLAAGRKVHDPLWRMPLWRPYLRYLTSGIADIANASSPSMAGSVTAALYLERFVADGQHWAHVDVFSWNEADRPGRPAGGEAQGLRAAWTMLRDRFAADA